ncbi:MAG: hypothetical protein WCI71_06485, partial [Bacteroidota bacterium]
MKHFLPFFLFLFSYPGLEGQTIQPWTEGTISFITSQNIYVKFQSTHHINKGDTLYIKQGDNAVPALLVTDLSSISCVCVSISVGKMNVSDKVFARKTN